MPGNGGWKSKGNAFRSPSPSLSDDFNQFHLGRDAQLARDLDLNSREDKAVFRDNPFAMAKRRAALMGTETKITEEKRPPKHNERAQSDKPKNIVGNIAPTALITTKSQPVLHATPKDERIQKQGGKRKAPAEEPESKQAVAKKKSKVAPKGGGWVNGKGQAVTSRPGKKSLLNDIDDLDKKKGGKKGSNASAKARKGGEDSVAPVFKKIPANAAPTADFPIVQGFERQKHLPLRVKATDDIKSTTCFPLSPDSDETDEIYPSQALLTLIKGLPIAESSSGGPDKASPRTLTHSPRSMNKAPIISSSYFGKSGRSNTWDEVGMLTNDEISLSVGHFRPAGSDDQLKTPPITAEDQFSQPSTMTHIGQVDLEALEKQAEQESSSSRLAYSSPLRRKTAAADLYERTGEMRTDGIVRPRPVRSRQIEGLNALAALEDEADIWQLHPRNSLASRVSQDSRVNNYANTVSAKQQRFVPQPNFEECSLDDDTQYAEEWSTLPPKKTYQRPPQRQARPALLNSRARTPTMSDKFHMPLRIFDHRSSFKKAQPTVSQKMSPLPKFTTPKHSRFFMPTPLSQQTETSSSTAYTVRTILGTQFGAIVDSGEQQAHYSHNTHHHSHTTSGQPAAHMRSLPNRPGDADEWMSAWKRPNDRLTNVSEPLTQEVDFATRAFRFGRA